MYCAVRSINTESSYAMEGVENDECDIITQVALWEFPSREGRPGCAGTACCHRVLWLCVVW